MTPVAVALKISGRVQGVGYRDAMVTAARRMNVHGWVRNCRDGTVEAVAAGPAAAVEALIEWARRGPPAARVDDVVVTPADPAGVPQGFVRRGSA